MGHPEGASFERADRVDFDRRVRLEFCGTQLSSDGGLLVMRELDDALGLSGLASSALCDSRPGKNTVHRLDGLFRQSVYGRDATGQLPGKSIIFARNHQHAVLMRQMFDEMYPQYGGRFCQVIAFWVCTHLF